MSMSRPSPRAFDTVHAEVDLDAVAGWLSDQGLPASITDAEPMSGGTQNTVIRLRVDGQRLVLRHPPAHPRPHSNQAIVREMTVLRSLEGTDIPHPAFFAGSEDPTVLGGAVFYLMQEIDGFNPSAELDVDYLKDPAAVEAADRSIVTSLARLAALDPRSVGLEDLGNPDGFLERQIDRQLDQFRSYGQHEDYDATWLGQLEQVAAWLKSHLPAPAAPALVHGDFQMSNLMLDRHRPRVAAILDWEMCTQGDPLLDLAWFLLCRPGVHEPGQIDSGREFFALRGTLTRSEVTEVFARESGRDVDSIAWYVGLAAFKWSVIVESTYLRSLAGKVDPRLGEYTHDLARRLHDTACLVIDSEWSLDR